MAEKQYDWAAIAEEPEICKSCITKKAKRSFSAGGFSPACITFPASHRGQHTHQVCSRSRCIGCSSISACTSSPLSQFFVSWALALYYANVANKEFDRLTKELIDELPSLEKEDTT